MKKIIFLFPIFLLIKIPLSFGQKTNKKLQDYFKVSLQYLSDYQRDTSNIYFKQGVALLIESDVDTLNLEDLKEDTLNYKIIELKFDKKSGTYKVKDIEEEKESKRISPVNPAFFMCECKKRSDSLLIKIYTGFSSIFGNETLVSKSELKTSFFQTVDGAGVFKLYKTDTLTNEIKIPSETISLEINNDVLNEEEDIFGSLEIRTSPYYEKDEFRFDSGFLYSQMKLKYLFKCQLNFDLYKEIDRIYLEKPMKGKRKKFNR